MKLRTGFVSNSSSCSFVLDKEGMTREQIDTFKEVNYKSAGEYGEEMLFESEKHFFGELSVHCYEVFDFCQLNGLDFDCEQ